MSYILVHLFYRRSNNDFRSRATPWKRKRFIGRGECVRISLSPPSSLIKSTQDVEFIEKTLKFSLVLNGFSRAWKGLAVLPMFYSEEQKEVARTRVWHCRSTLNESAIVFSYRRRVPFLCQRGVLWA